jgi:hypothetical protein
LLFLEAFVYFQGSLGYNCNLLPFSHIELHNCMLLIVIGTCLLLLIAYIHTYHSRFIPEGVAEVSQIFLRDTYILSKLVNYEEHCRRDRW